MRDPRVAVLIVNEDNPVDYVGVRGHVADVVRGPEARSHIDELAKRYVGIDDYPNEIRSERAILRIAAQRVTRLTVYRRSPARGA